MPDRVGVVATRALARYVVVQHILCIRISIEYICICEADVTTREADVSSVRMLGRSSDLTASIVAGLRRAGVHAIEGPAARGSPAQLGGPHRAADAIILVVDLNRSETSLAERHSRWSCRWGARRYEQDACNLAVDTVSRTRASHLMVVCDARLLTFGQRARATGLVRRVARRIDYECAINGFPEVATSYAVVDVDDDVARITNAVVQRTGDTSRRLPAYPRGKT